MKSIPPSSMMLMKKRPANSVPTPAAAATTTAAAAPAVTTTSAAVVAASTPPQLAPQLPPPPAQQPAVRTDFMGAFGGSKTAVTAVKPVSNESTTPTSTGRSSQQPLMTDPAAAVAETPDDGQQQPEVDMQELLPPSGDGTGNESSDSLSKLFNEKPT